MHQYQGDCSIPLPKLYCRTKERVRRIVDLSRRRDCILEAPMLNLEGLAVLAADYEAANLVCAAAELRKTLEIKRNGEVIIKI
jgi:hypothetical protein